MRCIKRLELPGHFSHLLRQGSDQSEGGWIDDLDDPRLERRPAEPATRAKKAPRARNPKTLNPKP